MGQVDHFFAFQGFLWIFLMQLFLINDKWPMEKIMDLSMDLSIYHFLGHGNLSSTAIPNSSPLRRFFSVRCVLQLQFTTDVVGHGMHRMRK